jgi:hypothetical protein
MKNERKNEGGEPMDLISKLPKKPGRPANNVLRVAIFQRKGSKYYQASIRKGKFWKRCTTRTQNPAAAQEFAELAYRQFSRDLRAESAAAAPQAREVPLL